MNGWDACILEPNAALRWIECHPGAAGWAQAAGTFGALLIAIFVPVFQRWLQSCSEAKNAQARSNRIVSLLNGEFMVLILRVIVAHRAAADSSLDHWGATGASKRLAVLKLRLPEHFWMMAQEIVRADSEALAPMEEFFKAAEYYNAIFEEYLPAADDVKPSDWPELIKLIRENIALAKQEGDKAWKHYFPDRALLEV